MGVHRAPRTAHRGRAALAAVGKRGTVFEPNMRLSKPRWRRVPRLVWYLGVRRRYGGRAAMSNVTTRDAPLISAGPVAQHLDERIKEA